MIVKIIKYDQAVLFIVELQTAEKKEVHFLEIVYFAFSQSFKAFSFLLNEIYNFKLPE